MDSFPDIRSFSFEELTAFLASLSEGAARTATDPAMPGAGDASTSEDTSLAHRRQVLNNKIDLVRAELADRRGRSDPGHG